MTAKSFTSDSSKERGARVLFLVLRKTQVGFYWNVLQSNQEEVRARPGPSEDSNLGVTPALSNTYKQRRFILISYSLLRNTNIIGSLASKGRRVPRAESEHKRKRKHAVSIPKRLILATSSISASAAVRPTLQL